MRFQSTRSDRVKMNKNGCFHFNAARPLSVMVKKANTRSTNKTAWTLRARVVVIATHSLIDSVHSRNLAKFHSWNRT